MLSFLDYFVIPISLKYKIKYAICSCSLIKLKFCDFFLICFFVKKYFNVLERGFRYRKMTTDGALKIF